MISMLKFQSFQELRVYMRPIMMYLVCLVLLLGYIDKGALHGRDHT